MLKKIIFMIVFANIPIVAMGCASDEATCIDLCEAGKDCTGADKTVDCAKTCADAVNTADTTGCSSEYSDALSCASEQDACSTDPELCKDEKDASTKCILAYCSAHANTDECTAN